MRGTGAPDGTTRVAVNGYHYTKHEGRWWLTHHLVAIKTLGRPLAPDEGVFFKDRDRTNLDPSNIGIRTKGTRSTRVQRARIEARIDELQAQLAALDKAERDRA